MTHITDPRHIASTDTLCESMSVAGCDVSIHENRVGVYVHVLPPDRDAESIVVYPRMGDALRALADMADTHDGLPRVGALTEIVFTE